MANAQTAGKFYIDSTGLLTDSQTKVSYLIFTTSAANDQIVLRETASGNNVLNVRGAVANNSYMYDFSIKPVVFQNGVYVQTLTAGATCTLVTTKAGD